MQHFMSNSPWSAWTVAVIQQVQAEIAATPGLERGGVLILNESANAKTGEKSAGSGRQYNGRLRTVGEGGYEPGRYFPGLCQWISGCGRGWTESCICPKIGLHPRWRS